MIFDWLRPFCTQTRKSKGILDEFDYEFYICFDCEEDQDDSNSKSTCDIHIVPVGKPTYEGVRVIADADLRTVVDFLFALGPHRFSDSIRKEIYLEHGL